MSVVNRTNPGITVTEAAALDRRLAGTSFDVVLADGTTVKAGLGTLLLNQLPTVDEKTTINAETTDAVSDLVFAAASELTIASGAITVTQAVHTVDTESDAASDNLDTISGLAAEEFLLLRPENAGRTVVLRHAAGNIYCPAGQDISLAEATDWVLISGDGTNAIVLAASTLATGGNGLGAALASTASSLGAALIGVEDSASNFSQTTVEGCLAEANDRVVKLYTAQVQHTDLSAAATSESIALASFPTNVVPIAASVVIITEFSGGSSTSVTAEIGDAADTNELAAAIDVFTGAGAGQKSSKATAFMGMEAAYAPLCTITSDVNVDQLTAGDILVQIWYRTDAA